MFLKLSRNQILPVRELRHFSPDLLTFYLDCRILESVEDRFLQMTPKNSACPYANALLRPVILSKGRRGGKSDALMGAPLIRTNRLNPRG